MIWRSARRAAATWLQLWITLGTGVALLLQRYIAEIEDDARTSARGVEDGARRRV